MNTLWRVCGNIPNEDQKNAMNQEDLDDDKQISVVLNARLKNVGAMFKGTTFGLFNVPRDPVAAMAVRTEATLLSMRRRDELPGITQMFI